ncbi:MAG: type II toxin-antitoxin system RelE/ParE family toxin [Burkholderiaceae bacterium]|nr:type II toxin-antitoxin system RelE/ParE family toxin [Burkholderiaceae bacterium]
MNISLSAEALRDAREAADWYIDQGAWVAALALQAQIDRALKTLARNPGLGTPGPQNTRLFPVRRFPISLVYRLQGNELRVIAVAAHRRRPGYWTGRS